MHCLLEVVVGVSALSCEAPGPDSHDDNDCTKDGCAIVESSSFLASLRDSNDASPHSSVGITPFPAAREPALSASGLGSGPLTAPTPPSVSWRFLTRAAPMVRAPAPLS